MCHINHLKQYFSWNNDRSFFKGKKSPSMRDVNLGPSGLLFHFTPLELLPQQPNALYCPISWPEFLTEEISAYSESLNFYFYSRSEKNSQNRFFTVPTFWLLIRTFAAATKKYSVSLIASIASHRLAHNFFAPSVCIKLALRQAPSLRIF